MSLKDIFLPSLVAISILNGCAIAPQKPPGTLIDLERLSHAHYAEITYTEKHATRVQYLAHLPKPSPSLKPMSCWRDGAMHSHLNRGAWIWKTEVLLGHPRFAKAFLQKIHSLRLNRIYLYLAEPLVRYRDLLHEASALGIHTYALAGDPSDVVNTGVIRATIHDVENYNASHHLGFAGMQFDVEPYALPSFQKNKQAIYRRYARLIKTIGLEMKGQLRWGMVVPFWFDDVRVDHESLLKIVMRTADNVTVMAYRSHYRNVIALANNSLCEGKALHKNVYIGIETSPIPDETDFVFSVPQIMRYIHYYHGQPYLDRRVTTAQAPITNYTVTGSEISFYPNFSSAVQITERHPKYASFSGWILDGLDEGWHVHKGY